MLLEGRSPCYEPLPTWNHESAHFYCSKYLGWATRHAPDDQIFYENWVGVEWMLNNQRKKLVTPSTLFQTIMHNEKQRYQFSRPIYRKAQPRRATRLSRASGQAFYYAKVYIRAYQGHSVSDSPMAALQLINEANIPNDAIHGTSIQSAKSIAKI